MAHVGRGKALVYAVIAALVGVAAYMVGVNSWLGQRAEASVLEASAFTAHPPAPLSLVSIPTLVIAFLILTALAWWAHGFIRALWILIFGFAAISASQLLKQELLVRPGLFELDLENTFPSGHMTVFTVLSAAFIWAVPRGARGVAAFVTAILMGTVGWQLLEYGWHRPSDIIGAQALGLLAFALAAFLRPVRYRVRGETRRVTSALNRVLGVALSITGIALLAGGLLMMLMAGWYSSSQLMLAACEVAVIGVSCLCARALMTLSV